MDNGETMLWKWVELPRFATFCRGICEQHGVSYENDFDEIRWSIMEDVMRAPFKVSHPDPRFTDQRQRYFRTAYAPGRIGLPPLVITFRIARFPEFGVPGEIEGREVWIEEELRQVGVSLEAADSI